MPGHYLRNRRPSAAPEPPLSMVDVYEIADTGITLELVPLKENARKAVLRFTFTIDQGTKNFVTADIAL